MQPDDIAQADILKLNGDELNHISGLLRLGKTDETKQAIALKEQFDLKTILITKGEAGAWMLDEEGSLTSASPGGTVQIVDTVGAGDAFASIFILGLFMKWTAEQTLMRADRFARAICGIRGGIPQDDAFYDIFRTEWNLSKRAFS